MIDGGSIIDSAVIAGGCLYLFVVIDPLDKVQTADLGVQVAQLDPTLTPWKALEERVFSVKNYGVC